LKINFRGLFFTILYFFSIISYGKEVDTIRLLIFSKTNGYRHTSIKEGKKALLKIAYENNYLIDTTENSSYFTSNILRKYSTIIFLNTTMDILDGEEQKGFKHFINNGGGFIGIHAAADTEYDWPWYGKLVGAYFKNHPPGTSTATITTIDNSHVSTNHLPKVWEKKDEWYNYKDINPNINILCNLEERSYKGGENGESHPIVWYHNYDGGRSFYTGFGHTKESFYNDKFLKLLLGAIQYTSNKINP